MAVVPVWLGDLPLPLRSALVGAAGLGALGGLAGLVLGLIAHPATAWFAILEVGVPTGMLGGVLGLLGGWVAGRLRP
ncbi:hypothetical protein ACVW00_004005 [Marmoricola sp. URHA0025 HA25]